MLEHTEDFPSYGVCRICHQFITSRAQLFCDEHLQHYEQRQREGVTTEDLSTLWKDNPVHLARASASPGGGTGTAYQRHAARLC